MAEIIMQQTRLFLISFGYGVILGIWYDIFRALRKSVEHRNKAVHMEDILFCFSGAAGLFLLFQICNQGRIRFYVLLGMEAGLILYFFLLSPLLCKVLCFIVRKLLGCFRLVGKGISCPVKLIVNSFSKSLKKTMRTVRIIKSKK
ncbi:MAG: spore cortex biosynthesis protein YabQ [Lachnospiraceae bacterium]|nr:spore cortex biosynthesis protein YabQ [Lachnospiraceae bacterium]